MEIGTAEPVVKKKKLVRRRGSMLSGGPGGPGKRGGGGGGGNDGGDHLNNDQPYSDSPAQDKSKIVAVFLLIVVMMTFAGLIGAYVVIATNGVAEWKPFNLPVQVWISTGIIIASSIAYHIAKTALNGDFQEKARKWFIATAALGGAFISSQLIVWLQLIRQGVYMGGNPYAGFFYMLTALHAIHVLGGIIALGSILLRSWHGTIESAEMTYRRNMARSVGWYWDFMGILWIGIVVLLGFWK
jgi:cytochrome c oxidase subunit 3